MYFWHHCTMSALRNREGLKSTAKNQIFYTVVKLRLKALIKKASINEVFQMDITDLIKSAAMLITSKSIQYHSKIERNFKCDTVHLCVSSGCETARGQPKIIALCMWGKIFLRPPTLKHKDVQCLIWKSLQILNSIVSSQERKSTFKVCYLCSKHLHLCNAYKLNVL